MFQQTDEQFIEKSAAYYHWRKGCELNRQVFQHSYSVLGRTQLPVIPFLKQQHCVLMFGGLFLPTMAKRYQFSPKERIALSIVQCYKDYDVAT